MCANVNRKKAIGSVAELVKSCYQDRYSDHLAFTQTAERECIYRGSCLSLSLSKIKVIKFPIRVFIKFVLQIYFCFKPAQYILTLQKFVQKIVG
jgi:hypothetical protein